jgi:MFS family permease
MSEFPVAVVLRRLVRPVYVPTLAAGITVGMLIPVLPLYLRDSGLSFSAVSVVLAAAGVGAIFGGLPSGVLLARLDERRVLAIALTTMAVTTAALGLVTATLALVAFRLAFGFGMSGFRLSIQSHVTRTIESRTRGRAMAYIGGSMRLAVFVGPLLGGLLVDSVGFEATFGICGALALIGLVGTIPPSGDQPPRERPDESAPSFLATFRHHRRQMLLGGFAATLVMTAREGRHIVVPLIADDLGLSPTAVGAVVAIGTGADLVLFPVAGHLMDRYGRLFAMVPAFSLMAVGLGLLGLADSASTVVVAGIVIGVGNGVSAGTLLTLGSDLAPRESPGPFLAGMGIMGDSGRVWAALVVGLTADAAGLSTAAAVLAGVLVVAITYLIVVVGETGESRSSPAGWRRRARPSARTGRPIDRSSSGP